MNYQRIILLLLMTICGLQLSAQEYHTNLDDASQQAREEDKQILLVFSGSDWCKPCILLKREVLHSSEFRAYAKDRLVLVNLDFPYQRKNRLSQAQEDYNAEQAERFNPEGQFPRTLLLNPDQEVLGRLAYKPGMTPDAFLAQFSPKL